MHELAGTGFTLSGDVNTIYPEAVHRIAKEGLWTEPRGLKCVESNPVVLQTTLPRQRLVTSYGRPVNVAFALAEVLWILQGRNDVKMLKFYNSTIDQWSDKGKIFNAPYGQRMRETHRYDQLRDVINLLTEDPESRQATIVYWAPADRAFDYTEDWDFDNDMINTSTTRRETKDRACNIASHMMIREGKLNWTQFMRSNDIMWGLPYNLMQFTHLQEWVASALGVETGHYIHISDSLHIYDYHEDQVSSVQPFNLYEETMSEHPQMKRANEELIRELKKAEEEIRLGEKITEGAMGVDTYWDGVLEILKGHRYYSEKDDEKAYISFLEGDPIYGPAQMRFCYEHRWHKKQHKELVQAMGEDLPERVFEWATRKAPQ